MHKKIVNTFEKFTVQEMIKNGRLFELLKCKKKELNW